MVLAIAFLVAIAAHAPTSKLPLPAIPAPPPVKWERPTAPPEYRATCQLVSREGALDQLSIEMINNGLVRSGKMLSTSSPLAEIRGTPYVTATAATHDWNGWEQTDTLTFSLGAHDIAIELTVRDGMNAAPIRVINMRDGSGIPLHAGMCRINFR